MRIQCLAAAALLSCTCGSALAGVTAFNALVGAPGELSVRTVLEQVYGGSFSLSGNNLVNGGGVTATRVQDFGGNGAAMLVNGLNHLLADDNKWSDGTVTIRFETKYAANTNTFGWYNNLTSPNTFLPLLGSVLGSSVTTTLSSDFEWGLRSVSGSGTEYWQSNRTDNANNMDHFVAYKVTGLAGGVRWLVAVEDLPPGTTDCDYNDWIGEIELMQQIVPMPPAAWLGLVGIGGLAGLRTLRRRG